MRFARGLVVLVCGLAASCGGPKGAPTGTVRGVVTFQGRALAGGTIVFAPHPERGPVAKCATATIGADGEFRLAVGGSPYLMPGWYRVAIAEPADMASDGSFPAALRRPDRAGVDREVIAGKENVFEFRVEVP